MTATIVDLAEYKRRKSLRQPDEAHHLSEARTHIALAQAHLISARPPQTWADCRIALSQLKEIVGDIDGWLSTIGAREPAVHTDSRQAEAHPNVPATHPGV